MILCNLMIHEHITVVIVHNVSEKLPKLQLKLYVTMLLIRIGRSLTSEIRIK